MRKIIYFLLIFLLFILYYRKGFYFRINSIINPNFYNNAELIKIKSSYDNNIQHAFWYKSSKKKPLIVSLHTWGGTYRQIDSLFLWAEKNDWNYIHPDYRGSHTNSNSCCYKPALRDIDDAIEYSINNSNINLDEIFVIGKSGGGSAVLSVFLTSKYKGLHCYSWSPITNYIQWHNEVLKDSLLKKKYLKSILKGTNSKGNLNLVEAKKKSPYFANFLKESEYEKSDLSIFTGIMDGIEGSTSIAQPIDFYNKILNKWKVTDSSRYVTHYEKSNLLRTRKSDLDIQEKVGSRRIFVKKMYNNVGLTIFDGAHEMIYPHMYNILNNYND